MNEEAVLGEPPAAMTRRINDAFLIYGEQEFAEKLRAMTTPSVSWGSLMEEAAENLDSVASSAILPFKLAYSSVTRRQFDRFHAAERVRQLKYANNSGTLDDNLEEAAFKIASTRMREFSVSDSGVKNIRIAVVRDLDASLDDPMVARAAKELVVQSIVSTWSVFERFAAAFIIAWINEHPRYASIVSKEAQLRSYFGKQAIDYDAVHAHGFDLTRSMGTILFSGKRLDSLDVIKSVFQAMFSSHAVAEALAGDMWRLNQRRHLLVHKRGILDDEYLKRTGDSGVPGERLFLSARDVEKSLIAAASAITVICQAALTQGAA